MKKYSVLIIDDHPLISEIYKMAFLKISSKNETIEFNIDIADDCDSAIEMDTPEQADPLPEGLKAF